ncbi:MAG: DUF1559 domain-containing protein, partial [Planctomycetota bacterium]
MSENVDPIVQLSCLSDAQPFIGNRNLIVSRLLLLVIAATTLMVFGCGESQMDRMKRAARRKRATTGETDEKPAEKKQVAAATADDAGDSEEILAMGSDAESDASDVDAITPMQAQNDKANEDVAQADTGDQPQSAAETGEELDPNDDRNHLTSVVDRRPDAPLSPEERQQRATKNLYRIAEALTAYVKEKEHWPSPLIRNGAGIETLSWRVELLPYLGYNKLYEKFDLDMPWNSIENKKLLKYIPDVFVSPERFDDKTNFMAPVSNGYFWDRDGRKIAEDAEDGLENTIVLVEVSNDYAVPWTKPTDLNVALIKNRAPLNGPRPDGNVALWGNFLPTLIDRSVNQLQLHNAFSYEAGDGQLASIIHRNLPLGEEVDDVGIAAMETMEQSLNTTEALPAPSDVVVLQPTLVEVQEIQRLAVPKRLTLQQSQKELRGIYADKLK